jgi:hypothetical protein
MKHVHDQSEPVKEAPKQVKTSEASSRFVDLFRRIAVEEHKEAS